MEDNTFSLVQLPVIALRGLVMFPGAVLSFDAGREKSIAALNVAMSSGKLILLVAQKDIVTEEPQQKDMYTYGCVARIRQMLKVNNNEVRVLVEGINRVKLVNLITSHDFNRGEYYIVPDTTPKSTVLYKEALIRKIKNLFEEFVSVTPRTPTNVALTVNSADNLNVLTNYVAANVPFEVEDKQLLLEEANPIKRGELLLKTLKREIELTAIDMKIAEKVKVQIDDNQRDYYLREQLKAVSDELYGETSPKEETDELREKINNLKASDEIKEKLLKEVAKLEKMPFGSQEASVISNYLDFCVKLPFGIYTKDNVKLKTAKNILEKEHYGLSKVKERISESLAVNILSGSLGGSILCLVGPPGVGKTSIAKSVAHAMNRKFARISLGGVHDEAEIRGHRRTYVGAMCGRILDAVCETGTCNPVILLDEIDKVGNDYKGDPASALLEVLDPAQNSTFKDHFADMPFDLSRVMFITTANTTSTIPAPLLDRMEIIDIAGYTRLDKFNIAKKYLVKKQVEKNGLETKDIKITNSALYGIIDYYTREAGVRKLEQSIATLCRKCAAKKLEGTEGIITIDKDNLPEYLGPARFKDEVLLKQDEVGIVNGLAWTRVGGTLMQLEASVLDGTGRTELTGSLGDVMKESARTAISYVRSIAKTLGVEPDFYTTKDFHINATEGAIPKDGPSAGITMVVALVSALTGIPVKRDVAMTGEITLRGRVMAIGGLKEKSMAAYTAGVKTVFIPYDNIPDLEEVDPLVKEKINFVPVSDAYEVISSALVAPVAKKAEKSNVIPTEKTKMSAAARQ